MLASKVAFVAEQFLAKIGSLDDGLKMHSFHVTDNAGQFRDIFRNSVKAEPGVYWFILPDGTVYDIGCAGKNVWERICAHAPQAVWKGAPGADEEQRTGEGWEFPTNAHLSATLGEDAEVLSIRSASQHGTFSVGWATVQPGHFANLLEVYL